MADELISTNAAGEAVGYTGRSLLRWVAEGKLKPTKRTPGGHVRWNLDDLRRQLAELEQGDHADDGTQKG